LDRLYTFWRERNDSRLKDVVDSTLRALRSIYDPGCDNHEEAAVDALQELAKLAGEPDYRFDDERTAKAIVADNGNDLMAAILALVRINHYLMRENGRLIRAVSPGFMRGSGGHRS
jgi:hypothetical protein